MTATLPDGFVWQHNLAAPDGSLMGVLSIPGGHKAFEYGLLPYKEPLEEPLEEPRNVSQMYYRINGGNDGEFWIGNITRTDPESLAAIAAHFEAEVLEHMDELLAGKTGFGKSDEKGNTMEGTRGNEVRHGMQDMAAAIENASIAGNQAYAERALMQDDLAREAAGEERAAEIGAAEAEQEIEALTAKNASTDNKPLWKFIKVDKSMLRPHKKNDSYTLRMENFTAKINGVIDANGFEAYVKGKHVYPDKYDVNKVGITLPVDKEITLKRYPVDPETGLRDYTAVPEMLRVSFDSLQDVVKKQHYVIGHARAERAGARAQAREVSTDAPTKNKEQDLEEPGLNKTVR